MGALPKKQMSKSKQRSRAAHYRGHSSGISRCPQCHSPKLSHHVCSQCGSYKGREIIGNKSE
ncbi:MAG: 50S ribosomal protein L32 [SAR202 cluster bacterium]|nr:50S ribosomal protein L32 [SAR202 cluster bacterium]